MRRIEECKGGRGGIDERKRRREKKGLGRYWRGEDDRSDCWDGRMEEEGKMDEERRGEGGGDEMRRGREDWERR